MGQGNSTITKEQLADFRKELREFKDDLNSEFLLIKNELRKDNFNKTYVLRSIQELCDLTK